MWMILANQRGADSSACQRLARLYNDSLDAEGCEALKPGFHRTLPEALRSNVYPAWMADKFEKRMHGGGGRGGGGSRGGGSRGGGSRGGGVGSGRNQPRLADPNAAEGASILDKLYAMDTSADGAGAGKVRLDTDLTTDLWQCEGGADVAVYKERWKGFYREYAERTKRLFGGSSEEGVGMTDDQRAAYDEIVKDFEGRLTASYASTPEEVSSLCMFPPKNFLSEVAAMYEACYLHAQESSRAERAAASAGGGAAEALATATATTEAGPCSVRAREGSQSRPWHSGPVTFPWRIAPNWLNMMKRKAVDAKRMRASCMAP